MGGSSARLRRLSKELDYSPDSTELVPRNSSHQCGMRRGRASCSGRWQIQSTVKRDEGTRAQQNRCRVDLARQTGAHECSRPCRLTSRISGRHHLLRSGWTGGVYFESLTFSRSSGQLVICRFLLKTQLMFLKKKTDPTSKAFDDDEWLRSLTEAQEITADIPQDTVVYDQQAVDLKKKSGPFKWANSCENTSRGGSSRSVRLKSQVSRKAMLQPGGLSPSFVSSTRVGRRITDRTSCQNQSRRKKLLRND